MINLYAGVFYIEIKLSSPYNGFYSPDVNKMLILSLSFCVYVSLSHTHTHALFPNFFFLFKSLSLSFFSFLS